MTKEIKNAKLNLNKIHQLSGNAEGFGFVVKHQKKANCISITFTDYSKVDELNYKYYFNKATIEECQSLESAKAFYDKAYKEYTTPRVKKVHSKKVILTNGKERKEFATQVQAVIYLGYKNPNSITLKNGQTYKGWVVEK